MEFLEGEHIDEYNESKVEVLGRTMAKMHLVSQKYVKQSGKEYTITDYKTEILNNLELEKVQNLELRNFLERARGSKAIRGNFPEGIIHSDITIINMLFIGNQLNGILDFDDMSYRYLIEDLGVTALSIFQKNRRWDLVKKFVDAYQAVRPLLKREKEVLVESMKYRNYLVGPVVFHVWGEYSEDMKATLEMEKILSNIKLGL